jgi:hypothetical protein
LNVDWRLDKEALHLSGKDTKQRTFAELPECFNIAQNYYA